MRSSELLLGACAAALALASPRATAQSPAAGFALDRFYPSAPGAGWFVMDDLDIEGGLGGAVELTAGYARNPLLLANGAQRLDVVSSQAVADLSAAVTYDRFRFYLDLPMPLLVAGHGGTFEGVQFAAPSLTPGSNPDSVTDARVGADVRLVGHAKGPFRLGAGAQVYVPSGSPVDARTDYVTDGTVRAMFRALAAGDLGPWRYAGQLGVHVRPLDETPVPGAPEGSELLFGAAAGRSFDVARRWALVVGPELFGETAFRSLAGENATGLEGLLTSRLEGTGEGAQLRVKLGAGGGIDPQFGAPQWRVLVAVELFSGGRLSPSAQR